MVEEIDFFRLLAQRQLNAILSPKKVTDSKLLKTAQQYVRNLTRRANGTMDVYTMLLIAYARKNKQQHKILRPFIPEILASLDTKLTSSSKRNLAWRQWELLQIIVEGDKENIKLLGSNNNAVTLIKRHWQTFKKRKDKRALWVILRSVFNYRKKIKIQVKVPKILEEKNSLPGFEHNLESSLMESQDTQMTVMTPAKLNLDNVPEELQVLVKNRITPTGPNLDNAESQDSEIIGATPIERNLENVMSAKKSHQDAAIPIPDDLESSQDSNMSRPNETPNKLKFAKKSQDAGKISADPIPDDLESSQDSNMTGITNLVVDSSDSEIALTNQNFFRSGKLQEQQKSEIILHNNLLDDLELSQDSQDSKISEVRNIVIDELLDESQDSETTKINCNIKINNKNYFESSLQSNSSKHTSPPLLMHNCEESQETEMTNMASEVQDFEMYEEQHKGVKNVDLKDENYVQKNLVVILTPLPKNYNVAKCLKQDCEKRIGNGVKIDEEIKHDKKNVGANAEEQVATCQDVDEPDNSSMITWGDAFEFLHSEKQSECDTDNYFTAPEGGHSDANPKKLENSSKKVEELTPTKSPNSVKLEVETPPGPNRGRIELNRLCALAKLRRSERMISSYIEEHGQK